MNTIRPYFPLIVVVSLSCVLAAILRSEIFVMTAMGFFLVLLAMLKLFDLRTFQRGFGKYDILTQRWPVYGLIYPFIELALGLAYLGNVAPPVTAIATTAVMGVGGLGILKARREGKKLNCACMGNVLQVPLSTVSIVENGGMIVMSLMTLFFIH